MLIKFKHFDIYYTSLDGNYQSIINIDCPKTLYAINYSNQFKVSSNMVRRKLRKKALYGPITNWLYWRYSIFKLCQGINNMESIIRIYIKRDNINITYKKSETYI